MHQKGGEHRRLRNRQRGPHAGLPALAQGPARPQKQSLPKAYLPAAHQGQSKAGPFQAGAVPGIRRFQPGLPGAGQLEWAILRFETG